MRFLQNLHPVLLLTFLLLSSFELPVQAQTFRTESFQGRDVVAGEILVRFRNTAGIQALAAQDTDLASAESVGRSGAVRLRSRNRNVTALLQAYRNRFDVLYAEPNHVWHASDIPNDALFDQQWGLRNTGQSVEGIPGTAGADIKANQAWDITEGSRGIVVGVIDSGVDYNHPDLAANIWSAPAPFTVTIGGQVISCAAGTHGFNAITRTCDPMDDRGHGTHVSGVIAGSGNNGAGISGVSRVGSIMGLKFLSATGSGTTADAIAAIDFAIQVKALFPAAANVRILNASWGSTFNSIALRDEISLTLADNMLLIAASGNSSRTNDLVPEYPASYDLPNILAVAATDNQDDLIGFSNWGTTSVHLGAPGTDVLSSLLSGTYGFRSGTSMAAPMVSGAAALVLSA
jgi:serine protease